MPVKYGEVTSDFSEVKQGKAGCPTLRDEGGSVLQSGARKSVVPSSLAAACPVPVIPAPTPDISKSSPGLSREMRLVAPMPGVIVICEKSEGEAVQAGDVVLILEAMKMENLVRSPVPGNVISILCTEGQRVTRGEVLALIGESGSTETSAPGKRDSK
jgi:biotin carboxyl carrier protein